MLSSYQFQVNKANANLHLLAPRVKDLALEAVSACWLNGFKIYVYEAWRSPERQLHLQTKNSPSKTITRAGPGFSFHQWGLAVDIAYGGPGAWSWNGDFDGPKEIFMKFGFEKPPSFESGHFQISKGFTIHEIQTIALASTVQGLWVRMGLDA